MIEQLIFKDLVDFKSINLEFENGLVVFTGPSGAGKSVLMGTILSSFGYQSSLNASLCELSINTPDNLTGELYEITDTTLIKSIKKDKMRYYLNDQNISKKSLEEMFSPFVKYLSVRDKSGIDSDSLVSLIDSHICTIDTTYTQKLIDMKVCFEVYKEAQNKLKKIIVDEQKIVDLIEFTKFEIEKISSINPKIGEDIALLEVKQKLSKLDKIKASTESCEGIFEFETRVSEFYKFANKDSSIFAEAMNQLRIDIDETTSLTNELEELDIETILGRLEQLTSLQNRYGSIEDSLIYLEQKKSELASFEHTEEDKSKLEEFIKKQQKLLDNLSQDISKSRKIAALKLEDIIGEYLFELKLPKAVFNFTNKEIDKSGADSLDMLIGSSKVSTLSGGEFNRLRLAVLVASKSNNSSNQGVLILDEIDANVSGDESIAIANMLSMLSASYQIFAISHQAHLTSKAKQHILVSKNGENSSAIILDAKGRIDEIARIISGESPTQEALEFAKALMI